MLTGSVCSRLVVVAVFLTRKTNSLENISHHNLGVMLLIYSLCLLLQDCQIFFLPVTFTALKFRLTLIPVNCQHLCVRSLLEAIKLKWVEEGTKQCVCWFRLNPSLYLCLDLACWSAGVVTEIHRSTHLPDSRKFSVLSSVSHTFAFLIRNRMACDKHSLQQAEFSFQVCIHGPLCARQSKVFKRNVRAPLDPSKVCTWLLVWPWQTTYHREE